jgi:hypothetical protein
MRETTRELLLSLVELDANTNAIVTILLPTQEYLVDMKNAAAKQGKIAPTGCPELPF